ncbi:hypothetical protein [Rhodococcus sp. LB1]|uniref:hypothetical protein n=1 Tax=Rhodococcus sp. LB1 TaxID=1807499 RepID=UPI00077ACF9F|nr:hypothetical protein [Rhodococcus sp. LB1]KXX55883.1 hypothetical protein AZG88_02300 [Rhodococcus sp. LB1]
METIVSDVELDGPDVEVGVALLPAGDTPLRVSAYRQVDQLRDEWTSVIVNVTVHPDGWISVSGDSGPVRIFVSARE